jgi:hypothetical protein
MSIFTEEDQPCDKFEQVDGEDNFDVCKECQYHRLDHAPEARLSGGEDEPNEVREASEEENDNRITVQDLIAQLSAIEDRTQPIVYQFYLAEHFDVSKEDFAVASAHQYHQDGLWSSAYASLKEFFEGDTPGYK